MNQMSDVMTFSEFILWAATPAGLFGMGSVLSMFLREYDKFQGLKKSQKASTMLLLNVIVLPLLFVYIPTQLSTDTIDAITPLANSILLGVTAYGGNQLTHELWNKKVINVRRTTERELDDLFSGRSIEKTMEEIG